MATAASVFVPEVIHAGIEKNLDGKFVLVDGCNREYEGDIKQKGDTVKVRTVGDITAYELARSADRTEIEDAEELDGAYLILTIDTIFYTNTKIDSIDELATDVNLMDATSKRMAVALAGKADKKIGAIMEGATNSFKNSGSDWALKPSNIVDMILGAKTELYNKNVPEESDLELCIDYNGLAVLQKAGIITLTDNVSEYKNGDYGKILGVNIKVSNNLFHHAATEASGTQGQEGYVAATTAYTTYALRVKNHAVAFANQVTKTIHYRKDDKELDADFLKSYMLCGAKIMFQDEIVRIPVASTSLSNS